MTRWSHVGVIVWRHARGVHHILHPSHLVRVEGVVIVVVKVVRGEVHHHVLLGEHGGGGVLLGADSEDSVFHFAGDFVFEVFLFEFFEDFWG